MHAIVFAANERKRVEKASALRRSSARGLHAPLKKGKPAKEEEKMHAGGSGAEQEKGLKCSS